MNNRVVLSLLLLSLSACAVPETREGTVHEITDHTVTVRGPFSYHSGPARPTEAMSAQAEAICAGAHYLSASPSRLHQFDDAFLYLFRCPNGPRRG